MFDSFKKWIQTTVDTTTNSVLTTYDATNQNKSNSTINTGDNNNRVNRGSLSNDFRRPQQNRGVYSSNASLSSNDCNYENNYSFQFRHYSRLCSESFFPVEGMKVRRYQRGKNDS